MSNEIRIPTKWLQRIAEDIEAKSGQNEWEFTTDLGNVLTVKRHGGPYEDHDRLDFEYNKGD